MSTLEERLCDLLEPHEQHEWNESDADDATSNRTWLCPGVSEEPEVVDPAGQARAANEAQLDEPPERAEEETDAALVPVARQTVMPLDADTTEGRIVSWARAAQAAYRVGLMLATTDFVSPSLKTDDVERTAQQIAASILAGDELGMRPMAALRSIAVIRGTPSLSALSIRALVRAAGHKLTYPTMRADRVVCVGERRVRTPVGWRYEAPVPVEWTIERARRLGLLTRTQAGRPNPWETQPQNMLIARATTEAARLTAPEVLLGIGYSSEELMDLPVELETAERAATAASGEPGTGVRRRQRRAGGVDADGASETSAGDMPDVKDERAPSSEAKP